jgi:hypothetical protein
MGAHGRESAPIRSSTLTNQSDNNIGGGILWQACFP